MKRIAMISLAASALVSVSAAAHPGSAPQPHVVMPPAAAHAPMVRPHHGRARHHMRRAPGAGHHLEKRIVRRHHGINGYPGYRRFDRGLMLPHQWWGPQFQLHNWGNYGLPQPMHGGRWVRYYDDALLVDGYGRIHDGRWGMKWDEWDREWGYDDRGVPVYVGNGDFHPGPQEHAWVEGQGRGYAHGYGHSYGGYGQAYGYAYPGCGCGYGMVITETTVTTAPTVIAETVYEDVVVTKKRVRAKPRARYYRPRPAPVLPGERG